MGEDLKNTRELNAAREANERAEQGPMNLTKAKMKLYDRIARRVSVRAMDIFIYCVVGAIVVAIVVGIIIGPS